MMPASVTPDTGAAPAAVGDDSQVPHESACLRPFCCNPFAAFSAFSRVGGWTPPLPETNATQDNSADA